MLQKFKIWAIRLTATAGFLITILVILVLKPSMSYSKKTTYKNFNICHNQPLEPTFFKELDAAYEAIKTSECYNPNLNLDICLNDGSIYPQIIQAIQGQGFAWGFYDKVVLNGEANFKENHVALNGYKWNLTQLLAHEMVHCLQFDKLGFWHSNPVANIPHWKWEGYAEYVARGQHDSNNLRYDLEKLNKSKETAWAIYLNDSTVVSRSYFSDHKLVQYCLDVKKMSYSNLLEDITPRNTLEAEMKNWYKKIKNK
jgi:hypothetical protein